MASSIQLLRSTTARERPFPSNLLEGQPAVNLNSSEPGLFLKATDGSLIKIGPAAITSDGAPPNSSPGGSSGNSAGEMWLDKSLNPPVLKVYDGASWVNAGSGGGGGGGSSAVFQRWVYTATGNESTVSGTSGGVILSYTPGAEEVFLNGALLVRGTDYTAVSGTSVSFTNPLTAGDNVSVLSFATISIGLIDGSSIIDGTITGDKLATETITSANIEDGTIVNSDINNSAAIESNKLSFTHLDGSAVARSIQDRLSDVFSVKDYGATGNGTTDDRTFINNAIAAAVTNGGGTVYFPAGTYRITAEIGNFNGAPNPGTSIKLVGEYGAVLDVNPPVFTYYAIRFQGANWRYLAVDGLVIKGNNKLDTGIRLSPSTTGTRAEFLSVNNCVITDLNAVDNVANTVAVHGMNLSGAYNVSITNCRIENLSRENFSPSPTPGTAYCQAIVCTANDSVLIQNNYIKNVTHNNQALQDADGIVVFSTNTSSRYSRQQAAILNNTIIDCCGRMIKLQTNGQCLVQGNLCRIENPSHPLIQNWQGVDCQVANATIKDNTFYIGDTWTGGASACMFILNIPRSAAAVAYPHEGFQCTVENNFVEVKKSMAYFCIPFIPNTDEGGKVYHTIRNNVATYAGEVYSPATSAYAFTYGCYVSSGNPPTSPSEAAEWYLDYCGNRLSAYYCYRNALSGGSVDYADKHFVRIFDNFIASPVTDYVFFDAAATMFTSTCMVRDNCIGPNEGNVMGWPVDLTKIMSGSDWVRGTQTITNAPPSSTNSRFFRQGSIWGVQTPTTMYSSSNGSTWNTI